MTREEVIERFCKLQTEVTKAHADYSKANDCFCPGQGRPYFRSAGVSLAYIEEAVRARLALEAALREQYRNMKREVRDLIEQVEDKL